jgi:hypothetical protein
MFRESAPNSLASVFQALGETVELSWRDPGTTDLGWFPGEVTIEAPPSPAPTEIVSCADPHAEVVESLRWVRELLASGSARPDEIAICATSTEPWDEHFLVLAASAELPIYFSHGVAALSTREGQACAALADVLLNGLSQDRVLRLLGHAAGRGPSLAHGASTRGRAVRDRSMASCARRGSRASRRRSRPNAHSHADRGASGERPSNCTASWREFLGRRGQISLDPKPSVAPRRTRSNSPARASAPGCA